MRLKESGLNLTLLESNFISYLSRVSPHQFIFAPTESLGGLVPWDLSLADPSTGSEMFAGQPIDL